MKILLLHQYYLEENGAGGSRFNEMTKIWEREGHSITVIAGMMPDHNQKKKAEYKGKLIYKKKHGNINVYRCHVSEGYNRNFLGRFSGYFSFMSISLFVMLKLKERFDVLIVTSPPLNIGINALIYKRLKKSKLVFEVRDLWPDSVIETGVVKNKVLINLMYFLERKLYNKADLITVLTPAFKKVLIENKSVPEGKIIYVPNAADFQLSDPLLNNFNSLTIREKHNDLNSFVIIYVGAHGLANGLHQIIDTAELLKNTNVVFWLIGKGMMREDLKNEAKAKGLTNIKFLEPLPKAEILKYILASDMGVSVLIKREVFKTIYSNKTFDYLACKKPVFMLIDGISRELIETADGGIYVEPENPRDFADKILMYKSSPVIIKRQGEHGYSFIKKHFDRETLALEYLRNLSSLN